MDRLFDDYLTFCAPNIWGIREEFYLQYFYFIVVSLTILSDKELVLSLEVQYQQD